MPAREFTSASESPPAREKSASRRCPAAALLLMLSVAGCSLMAPKLQRPQLSVIGVELLKSDLWHQELKVRMQVENPNDRRLPVKGLSYVLEVDGEEFAHGESGASFVVPPLGEAEFDMSVSANMASMLVKVLGQGGNSIDYHISGRITLSEGLLRSIPFDQSGTFKLQ
jgi:LEA14-like dessication related protein